MSGAEKVKLRLLQSYKDISALPMSGRKDFYRRASSYDKGNLWRVHLALYIVKNPELTGEQKGVVLDAMSMATPELFEIPKDSPAWRIKVGAPLESLTQRALEVFSK